MTRSKVKVKVTRHLKLEILRFSKSISSAIFNVSWQMTTDSETTEQYLTFVRSRFLISVLVFGITADKNHIRVAGDTPHVLSSLLPLWFKKINPDLFAKTQKPRRDQKKPRSSGKNLLLQYHSPGGGGVMRSWPSTPYGANFYIIRFNARQ